MVTLLSTVVICGRSPQLRFGLVYMFIHSVTHVTLGLPITDYNLYITTQLICTSTQYIIINNNIKFEDQLEVEFVTTSRYMCIYINYLRVKNSN